MIKQLWNRLFNSHDRLVRCNECHTVGVYWFIDGEPPTTKPLTCKYCGHTAKLYWGTTISGGTMLYFEDKNETN